MGPILQFAAVVLSVAVGFKGMPAVACILGGAVLFEVAYVFVRLPQMSGMWARDGIGIVKLVFFQLILNGMIAAFFYWVGRGVAHLFS